MGLTFKNFTAKQLQNTPGFSRKLEKVASNIGIVPIYFEIINIEETSIDVLIIDEGMFFFKVHLYSQEAIKMLNKEFSKLIEDLGVTTKENLLDLAKSTDLNVIDDIENMLSCSIELLNFEQTESWNKLEKVTSSEFNVNLESFTYPDLYNAMEPLVKDFIYSTYKFKILNLSKHSVEILAITNDCRLYQYTILLDSHYSKFINRYLSAIIPYEQFGEMKKNLKIADFSSALKLTVPSYNTRNEKLNTCAFLSFLVNKYQKDRKDEGIRGEGLKNVYKFFLDTSANEEEARKKVLRYFMEATTYEQKIK